MATPVVVSPVSHPVKKALNDGIAQVKQVLARLEDIASGIPDVELSKAVNTKEGHGFIDNLLHKVEMSQTLPEVKDIVVTEIGKLRGWVDHSAVSQVTDEPVKFAPKATSPSNPPPANPSHAYPKTYYKAGETPVQAWKPQQEQSLKADGWSEMAVE